MPPLLSSILDQVHLNTIVDIGITALLIYWLFKLIRGTRAVRLVIGVSVLVLVYGLALFFDLHLLTQILQAGAVVGLFALVVIFQPELRRALERIGRVGSFGWLLSPAESRAAVHVSTEVARAAAELSADGQGALIVLQRETGLEEVAETGVMIHGDVSADLLRTIFTPKSPLHDGAVIIRDDRIVAAGTLLPLAETSIQTERFGTRHRAALGITEQTDAIVVVVSEENGQISLVERARIVRNLTEAGLARAIQGMLDPAGGRVDPFGLRHANRRRSVEGRSPRLRELGRFVGRPPMSREPQATVAVAPAQPMPTPTPISSQASPAPAPPAAAPPAAAPAQPPTPTSTSAPISASISTPTSATTAAAADPAPKAKSRASTKTRTPSPPTSDDSVIAPTAAARVRR